MSNNRVGLTLELFLPVGSPNLDFSPLSCCLSQACTELAPFKSLRIWLNLAEAGQWI